MGIAGAGDKILNRGGAGFDVQEFIAVQMRQPVHRAAFQMCHHAADAFVLRCLTLFQGVRQMVDCATGGKGIEQAVGAIGAVIGADEDRAEADGAVIGQPFDDMDAFVAHAGHERDGGGHSKAPGRARPSSVKSPRPWRAAQPSCALQ